MMGVQETHTWSCFSRARKLSHWPARVPRYWVSFLSYTTGPVATVVSRELEGPRCSSIWSMALPVHLSASEVDDPANHCEVSLFQIWRCANHGAAEKIEDGMPEISCINYLAFEANNNLAGDHLYPD